MYNERNKQGTFNICLLQIFFFATGFKNFTNTIYFILGKYGSLFEVLYLSHITEKMGSLSLTALQWDTRKVRHNKKLNVEL